MKLWCVDSPVVVVVVLMTEVDSARIYLSTKGALSEKRQSSVYSSYTITNLDKS